LPVSVFAVYVSLYYFLPILEKRKYTTFLLRFVLASGIILVAELSCSKLFFYLAYSNNAEIPFMRIIGFTNTNSSHSFAISVLSVAIKMSKNWYLKQKTNHALAKQKITS